MRTRASAFCHSCKGPRAERAALRTCEWSLRPREPAPLMLSMFSSAICFACKSPSQTLSGRHHRQGLHSAAVTSNLRPSASNPDYCPRACVAVLSTRAWPAGSGAGCWTIALQFNTQARAAMLQTATQVDHELCTPAKVATTAACSVVSRAFRLERSKPLDTKRRGENNRKA